MNIIGELLIEVFKFLKIIYNGITTIINEIPIFADIKSIIIEMVKLKNPLGITIFIGITIEELIRCKTILSNSNILKWLRRKIYIHQRSKMRKRK